MADCEAKVTARHPQMQKLLERFSDKKGDPMSVHWMTPTEKKAWKAERKAAALAEAEALTYGDRTVVTSLKAKLDTRVHALVNRLSFDGINLFRADLDKLATTTPAMGTVLAQLRSNGRATMQSLVAQVAQNSAHSDGTAQRDTYAAVSILVSSERAQRVGPFVELK
jgi:hypothetical protein